MSDETEWVLVPRALLEAAVCPMKECGCDGMQYPVEPNGEGEQCQWCYERTSALSAPQPPAEAQPVGGLRMVKLSDAWDYAHGALSWNELDARAIRCPAEAQAQGEAVVWLNPDCEFGEPFSNVQTKRHTVPLYAAPPSAPVGVAEAWQQGYHQGVQDERTSEANIGIAGFGAKVEPARNNPYLAQQPAAPHTCSNCEGVSPESCLFNQQPAAAGELAELVGLLDEVRSHFTRDDDLPDDLLPRIDAALAGKQGGSDNDR